MTRRTILLCTVTAIAALAFASAPAHARWRASVDSLYAVAELHYQGQEYSSAARLFEETSALIATRSPEELGPYFENLRARSSFLYARSLEQAGDWEAAFEASEAGIAADPDQPNPWMSHVRLLMGHGDYAVAWQALHAAEARMANVPDHLAQVMQEGIDNLRAELGRHMPEPETDEDAQTTEEGN